VVPLPPPSWHAFALAVHHARLPLEVLQRIFSFAAVEEKRVVTRNFPSAMPMARRRHHSHRNTLESPPNMLLRAMCLDADEPT
jgi:hypothetical protein